MILKYSDLHGHEIIVTVVEWKGVHYIGATSGKDLTRSTVSNATTDGEAAALNMVERMAQRHMWRPKKGASICPHS